MSLDVYLTTPGQTHQCDRANAAETALRKMRNLFDGVDNGKCMTCRVGFRSYGWDHGQRIIKPCENPECLSHEVAAVLGDRIVE